MPAIDHRSDAKRDILRNLLSWLQDVGVSHCLVPQLSRVSSLKVRKDTAQGKPQGTPALRPAPATQLAAAPATQNVLLRAGDAAKIAAAENLDALRRLMHDFDACPLKEYATNTVFARGDAASPLLCVGEAPGSEEDRQGLPFVGRSGRLLDLMLAAIGLAKDAARITNILPWRPPGNRAPAPAEIEQCLPFVVRHIELMRPKVILALGGVASQALLGKRDGIMRLRKSWHSFHSPGLARPIPVKPSFHPAYLLRAPGQKKAAWHDMMEVQAALAKHAADKNES